MGDKEAFLAMGFQEAFQVGKKYLRLSTGRKVPIRKQYPPSKNSKPGGFMGNPAGGLSPMARNDFLPMPQKEVGSWGAGEKDLLMNGRKERGRGLQEGENRAAFPKISTDQRLLNSFPERKNAELEECSRGSKVAGRDHGADDQIAVVFFLTRRLLAKTDAPLDARLIRDDDRLGRALGRVHPRLPVSIRLVLRKKRYIQFMLDNRERLIP